MWAEFRGIFCVEILFASYWLHYINVRFVATRCSEDIFRLFKVLRERLYKRIDVFHNAVQIFVKLYENIINKHKVLVKVSYFKTPSFRKKVVIHVPYRVKNVKHTHTIYKIIAHGKHHHKSDEEYYDDY
ncbi:hypothetical protein ALC57_12804 [Trachymyrmex cornetzi]|uniref:Uncharacterized protein n=1 Tax=Trachymyrmex cornetzi TaxID=471704 RepID=A0A151J0J5_9HYME|nr:hypothetical protein ALC57_12804 [Trachymyrmex cornetzi]